MSTQIQFRAGQPQKFIATRSFALGNSGMNIQVGSELMFDGTHVTYDGSHPVVMVQLRGAVKAGWIVPADSYNPHDLSSSIPKSAGVTIRNAQGGNPMDQPSKTPIVTVDAEEREVGNIQAHAREVKDRNLNYRAGRRVDASSASVVAQEGVEVRKLTTPTRWETNLERTTPGEAISQANSVRVRPGEGRTREDLVAQMSDEEREEYLSRIEAHRTSHAAEEDPEALRERKANEARLEARRVVGKVNAPQNTQREGFNVTNSVGGGTEIADVSGLGGEIEETVTSEEGLTFRNTNTGKPKAKPVVAATKPVDQDARRRIARAICPDFPDNYEFDAPVRKKIARLQADYDDRPDVIRAVAAADTDLEVRTRLLEEFPGAFA